MTLPTALLALAQQTAAAHPEVSVSLMTVKGTILYTSARSQEMLGYDLDEMVGHNFAKHVLPADLFHAGLAIADALLTDKSVTVSARVKTKAGSYIMMRGTARRLTDEATGKTYLLAESYFKE